MISSSNKISRREEVNELFEQLGQVLEQRVEALLIGGAVMLELRLKDSTKGYRCHLQERGGQGKTACRGQSPGL